MVTHKAELGYRKLREVQCSFRSQVFVWREGRFRLDHVIPSARATDVIFLRESEVLVLTSDVMGVSILVRSVGGVFTLNSTLSTQPALKVEAVGVSPGGVVITYVTSPAQLYNVTTSAIGTVATPISVSGGLDGRGRESDGQEAWRLVTMVMTMIIGLVSML